MPAAVEALFRPVVDAGDAGRGQLHRHHVEGQIAVAAVAAEPPLGRPLSDLVVVVHQGHHLVAVPPMPRALGLVQHPVAENGEVVHRVRFARYHPLQPSGHVVDPEGRVHAGPLHHLPGEVPPARHLPGQ